MLNFKIQKKNGWSLLKLKSSALQKSALKKAKDGEAGRCISLSLALGRQLQLDPWDFQASLVYLELQGNLVRCYLKKKKHQRNKEKKAEPQQEKKSF